VLSVGANCFVDLVDVISVGVIWLGGSCKVKSGGLYTGKRSEKIAMMVN
jgi:hypothetical protein